ncbi:carboxylic ester hydrolase NDAI_0G01090 [Naumovozyma dairenensis CBS 421]|uniref:AB hydrolase-1 domain-containing protein n=1 Tax=Naumovozyma dairenensis (strain ATCC 10597 / BCRC 20456 / CBS 421 / NBRC 0211 / NRRL Y-12639) TaxID=1071378 RepID=G0WDM4_NAUDC|nr:hypothetical protein NDAI_0G01090 [Naumovozyma dairenensis CBS 421]CCD25885.2 hypothetical protein NDAI_0G01090 [Naumovozyma dairenensis CBS 421]
MWKKVTLSREIIKTSITKLIKRDRKLQTPQTSPQIFQNKEGNESKRSTTTTTTILSSPATTTKINTIAPTPPTAIPLLRIITSLPKLFPRSIKQSIQDYKIFQKDPERLQIDLLKTLPFFSNGAKFKTGKILKTQIEDNDDYYINEFCITPDTNININSADVKHLIFIHGYGAGLGFFIKNLENIPLLNNRWCIHAIDLPGYGYSTRNKKFPFKYPRDSQLKVQNWFHDKIHIWLQKRNLLNYPKNNLIVAHSLGAYLMAQYAFKFPSHFQKLIMCSPAGVTKSSIKKLNNSPPWWYEKLWDLNFSPFSIVRNSGIYGSKITSAWSYRRFKPLDLDHKQFEALHRYAYSIFNRPGCGEYLLSFILSCGGNPRFSLEDTLFQRENLSTELCDWGWIYGDNDWMDINGAKRVSRLINEQQKGKSDVHVIPSAGHHLYLDNYKDFNKLLIKEMEMFGER